MGRESRGQRFGLSFTGFQGSELGLSSLCGKCFPKIDLDFHGLQSESLASTFMKTLARPLFGFRASNV